jgi:serine/threonine protein kinase
MQIAHQSAEALAYLHSWASPPILHGDVKSANILINLDYTVKVSDFGASILAPTDESQFVTIVQGTCGYLDPEYMQTCQLTDKSDVYSFGVVLLELLTRKKPLKLGGPEDEKSLALKFISLAKEGKIEEIFDYEIKNEENMEVLEEVAELAKQCLEMSGANRPSMKDVSEKLGSLRKVMQHPWAQQQNPEEVESLLGESPLASSEVINTGNFSIENKAAKSLKSGR